MDFNQTALVLIDIQNESQYGIEGLNEVIANSKELIEACRSKDIPIIYTRQINRADGIGLTYKDSINDDGKPIFYCSGTDAIEVVDEIYPLKEDIVIDKYRWSGFYQTSLDLILKSLNVKYLVMGGLVTDGCLMTSVFDGHFRDYEIHLVKDMCATTNEGAHMASILIMANWVYGIKIYDTSEMIKLLQGKDYAVWESKQPDELKFSPENIRELFEKLTNEATFYKQS